MSTVKISFTASGYGEFPLELLSYSECYPKSQEDSFKLKKSLKHRTINFEGSKRPSVAVWLFKGWKVSCNIEYATDNYEEYHTWPC